MADVNEEVLNAASQATYGLDYPGGLRRATGLDLDPNGICQALFGKEVNEAGPEMLALVGSHGLLLDGTAGAYASTPDHASLDIVGDIDLRVEFVPFGFPVPQNIALVAKWTAAGNLRSYLLQLGAFGLPDIRWSINGTAEGTGLGIISEAPRALRATLDVDNGAAGNTNVLYRGESMDSFTQFDDNTNPGTTNIFSGSAPLTLGASDVGTARMLQGRITRAQVRAGIDGAIVANPDFRNLAPGTTSFADSTGKTWTVHGTARVV